MSTAKSVLSNFKYIWLKDTDKYFQLLKNDIELDRLIGDESIKDGDMVVELTPETLRVAELVNFIKLT